MYLLTTNPDSAKMIESTRRSHQFPIENRYMSSDYNRSIFGLSVEKRTFPVCLYTYISMILLCTLFCFCGRRFPSGHLLPFPTGGVTERLSLSLARSPSFLLGTYWAPCASFLVFLPFSPSVPLGVHPSPLCLFIVRK